MADGPGNSNRRSDALDAYIAKQTADGFRVETRSGAQAVLVRRHPLYFVLHRFPRVSAEKRFVVSVDEHGEVAAFAAQPRRW
jgi:hypothetical protein